ncbi:MAG TPA: hypothetical protein VGR00_14670, partial [Thermoanaerobaculia bacterium]|nr:hypothetical protein [Thermoanaerobaculia bacterium]
SVAATALDALFASDPPHASAIAEERLRKSLDADCVPGPLVELMARNQGDPFAAVERRLSELDCDRSKLRPRSGVRIGPAQTAKGATPAPNPSREAAERMSPGRCRAAFESLFLLDAKEDEIE